jgi:FixJ family two-component response regulator
VSYAENPVLESRSPQERRVLDLIAEEQTNKQIAESMFLAEHRTTSRAYFESSR